MVPFFALTLSEDGIGLFQRAGDSWLRLGEALLGSDTLGADMMALRNAAEKVSPTKTLNTALILPDSQILYLDVDTPENNTETLERALDGRTPYALSELRFDAVAADNRTQLAAVAQETLDEAASFAADNGFTPVCFQACSEHGQAFWLGSAAGQEACVADRTAVPRAVGVGQTDHLPKPAADKTDEIQGKTAAPLTPLPPPEMRPTFETSRKSVSNHVPEEGAAPRMTLLSVKEPSAKPSTSVLENDGTAAPIKTAPTTDAKDPGPKRLGIPEPLALATVVVPPPPANEAEALTVFGARPQQAMPAKPRNYGIAVTGILLVALTGAATWAALNVSSKNQVTPNPVLTEIVPRIAPPEVTVQAPPQISAPAETTSGVAALNTPQATTDFGVQTASPISGLPEGIVAPDIPQLLQPQDPFQQAVARFEVNGIWTISPEKPNLPSTETLENLYLASLDPLIRGEDAIALTPQFPDAAIREQLSPPPAGQAFALDERGLVIPTPEGALSPEGVLVFAGRPAVVPPPRPATTLEELEQEQAAAQADAAVTRLAAFKPQPRPTDFADTAERAVAGGFSQQELAAFRPAPRPESAQDQQIAQPETSSEQSEGVIVASLYPRDRPAARAAEIAKQQSAPVAVAVPKVAVVSPTAPTATSVARQATVENAINLRRVNLIGVYGSDSDRRALVRLSSGKFVKVQVGDRLDGGQVSSISDSELRYTKNGRNLTLGLSG